MTFHQPRPMAGLPHQQPLAECLPCPHTGAPCAAGLRILARLNFAIGCANVESDFEIEGTAQIDDCVRPCTLGWRATGTSASIFGDLPATAAGCPQGDQSALILSRRQRLN